MADKPTIFKKLWFLIGFILTGLASFIIIAGLIRNAIEKVMTGHALETFWVGPRLVKYDYIGYLVLFGAIVLALLFAIFVNLRDHLEWQAFKKKYGSKDKK